MSRDAPPPASPAAGRRPPPPPSGRNGHRSFVGAAVVQLVAGRPERGDAVVADLHPATVVLTDTAVSAVDGRAEWSWRYRDLAEVHHGGEQPWSIFVVPGVPDHGVTVAAPDVADFRHSLDALRAGAAGDGGEVGTTSIGRDDLLARISVPVVPVPVAPPPVLPSPDPSPDPGPVSAPEPAPPPPVAPVPVAPVPVAPPPVLPSPSLDPGPGPAPEPATRVLPAVTPPGADPGDPTGLEAREISAWFGTHQVLDRVSLEMPAGEVTALIGPSGCGKSTFLRILNRMHELTPSATLAGEVLLAGADIYDPARKLTEARRQIGMVFQKPNPFPAMSIYDNVIASLKLTGTKAGADLEDHLVETCLAKAGLWNEVRDRLRQPGGGLSGGQQQRLCIARALAIRPRVLLMDEPCSALDPTSTRRIEQTITELAAEVTIVIVTHNMQQAARVSHRCAFFLAEHGTPGVIVEHGPTEAMFGAPRDPRTSDYVHGRFG